MLTCLAAGLTPLEIILNGISKDTDVAGGGRHMSNHFAKPAIDIQNVSSCTGNHAQHAVGLARAVKTYGSDAVVFCSQGESSVSEGYVYEAVNGASLEKLPVVFVIQDNGYGIAVPKSDQTANADVCDNFTGFLQPADRQVRRQGPGGFHAGHAGGPGLRAHPGPARPWSTPTACASAATPTATSTSSTAPPRSWPRPGPRIPCRASARYCLAHGVAEAELEADRGGATWRSYNAASDAALKAPDPDPASIYEYVVPEPWVSRGLPGRAAPASGDAGPRPDGR